MNSIRIVLILFVLAALPAVLPAREGISVSPTSTNDYNIPPERTSNTILFDVTITGQHRDMPYRYRYALDGNWVGTKALGTGTALPDPKYSSFGISISHGTHFIYVSLQMMTSSYPEEWREVANGSTTVALTQYHSAVVQNSFGGGNVNVDQQPYPSGTSFVWAKGSTHALDAINWPNWGGYVQWFDRWTGPNIAVPSDISQSITITQNATYSADFNREFHITFVNNLPGAGNVGTIKVGGNLYNITDGPFIAIETYGITVEAVYQVINGIEYTFSSWSPGGSTSASTIFYPTDHTTYTANFNAKPMPPTDFSASGQVGNPVHLTWTDNPNSNVTQYEIWRRVKPLGGSQGPPSFLGTVNSGVQEFDDTEYLVTSGYTDYLLTYDVRSYYSVNSSTSDPNWSATQLGELNIEPRADKQDPGMKRTGSVPMDYAVSSYPNPFNPSTTITYQLVEEANVSLHIFDVMGREVTSLVNDRKNAGYHSIPWHGKDNRGINVASGTYFYRFTASPISGSDPFIRSGKLLLTK